jgi:hypothetical protein
MPRVVGRRASACSPYTSPMEPLTCHRAGMSDEALGPAEIPLPVTRARFLGRTQQGEVRPKFSLVLDACRHTLRAFEVTKVVTTNKRPDNMGWPGAYWTASLLPRQNPSLRVLPVEFPTTRHKVAIITLKNRSPSRATELSSTACVPSRGR